MLLTLFYKPDCFKSRFLRGSARMMDWELRELDLSLEESVHQYIAYSEHPADAFSVENPPPYPSIYTAEVYGHELYPMIEYMSERSPSVMLPVELANRMSIRSCISRVQRAINDIWDDYLESRDPAGLLSTYSEFEDYLKAVASHPEAFRGPELTPSFIDVLFLVLQAEVLLHRPITDPDINRWYKSLISIPAMGELANEAGTGLKMV